MATEHEIERLLVRLVGNSDQFREMLSEAQKEIKAVAEVVEDAGDKVESIEDTINSLGESALVVGSALIGLGKALDQVSGKTTTEAIENAKQQEEATVGLISAIEAQGGSVERLLPRYQKWSAEMQELTVYGNEQIEMWLRYALTLGASGHKAKEAVKLGLAISESLGMSVQQSLRAATELQQGVLRGRILWQMPAHIKKIEDESKRAAEALRYMSKQFNLVENRAKTLTGAQKQLSETWADFIKAIGQELAPALLVVTKALRQVAKWFDSLPRPVKILVAGFFAIVSGAAMLSKALGGLLIATVVLEKAFIGLGAIKTTLIGLTGKLAASKVVLSKATATNSGATKLETFALSKNAAAMMANVGASGATATAGLTLKGVLAGLGKIVLGVIGGLKGLVVILGSIPGIIVYNLHPSVRGLSNALEESEELTNKWVASFSRGTDKIVKEANKLEGVAKKTFIVKQVEETERAVEMYANSLANAKEKAEEMAPTWKSFWQAGRGNWQQQLDVIADLEARLEAYEARLAELGDMEVDMAGVMTLEEVKRELEDQTEQLRLQIDTWHLSEEAALRYTHRAARGTDELEDLVRATKELRQLEKEKERKESFRSTLEGLDTDLQKQQDALRGVSSEYRTLLEVAEKYGWASEQAEAVRKRIDRKAVLDRATATKEVTDELLDQVVAWGKTEREMALYELAAQGVGKEQLRIVDGLHRMQKAQADYDSYLREATAITEKYLAPQEKLEKQRQRLFDMYHLGMITIDEYNKELESLWKQASKDFTVDIDVRGIEAVEWGSAAMHDLMAEYEMGLQRPELPDLPEPKPEVSKEAQAIIDAQLHKDDRHEKTVEEILNKIFRSLDDRDALMIEAANLSNKS